MLSLTSWGTFFKCSTGMLSVFNFLLIRFCSYFHDLEATIMVNVYKQSFKTFLKILLVIESFDLFNKLKCQGINLLFELLHLCFYMLTVKMFFPQLPPCHLQWSPCVGQ